MNVFEEILADANGALLLADWLGDGGAPVEPFKAEFRAQHCLSGDNGKPCPHNREPGWWDRHTKDPVAQWMRKQLELKNRMSLRLSGENELGICDVCGCCLKLLVWSPIERIREHTDAKEIEKLPNWCWKRAELEDRTR